MKERNHAFDFLCGICIIRMILLHVTNNCGFGETDWWKPVMAWTYFFMSFFFFKAGYFNRTISGNSREYCIDKFRRLMVPYFVWGFIGDAIYLFFAAFILDPKNSMVKLLRWDHIWTSSDFYGNVPCWFLMSFFVAYIAMHFISKVRGLRWVVLLFPILSWWLYTLDNPLWLGLNNVFFGIFLFFLGRVWRWVMERLRRRNTIILSTVLVGVFAWMNINMHGEYNMSGNQWSGSFPSVIISTVTSLCGISGLLLSLHTRRVPLINYIGQHSMVFFVAHYPLLLLYKMIRSANVRTLRGHWDDYTLLVLILFGVCLLLVPYVERVPWLSGRYRRKTADKQLTTDINHQ